VWRSWFGIVSAAADASYSVSYRFVSRWADLVRSARLRVRWRRLRNSTVEEHLPSRWCKIAVSAALAGVRSFAFSLRQHHFAALSSRWLRRGLVEPAMASKVVRRCMHATQQYIWLWRCAFRPADLTSRLQRRAERRYRHLVGVE
jgi:hypothetical protein